MNNHLIPRSPCLFIPTLYFAEGIPYVIVNNVSVIFYKNLGISNAQIAFWTSLVYLPWVIKMFWSPFVDSYATKRSWIIGTQIAMMCCLGLVAVSFQLTNFFTVSLISLILAAFISATHDIAADGFYLLALNTQQQAFFVGIRSVFYKLATIFGTGFLVICAGRLASLVNVTLSWTIVISASAFIFALLAIFHSVSLPQIETSHTSIDKLPFWLIFKSYFRQERIGAIVAFILLYRLGEAMLLKLVSPFLLDKPEVGGLGLSTAELGLAYGTFGVLSLIIGGLVGGTLIAKYGLKKSILPMALAVHLPNLFFVYMAYVQPPKADVYLLVALDEFGYGLGFTAFSVYLMYISRGEYKTSHFAISTGLMALGMMLPGFVSGYLQQAVGYPVFFILVCLLTIPGMIALGFIPLDVENSTSNNL
ncbi:MAG: MFS transporter [Nostocaceae cyanobacterium]|nr:MFS transporter [Nostocaceae cyanobacterium]